MEIPAGSVKNRSPRLARKDNVRSPNTTINLTRVGTASATTSLPQFRSTSTQPMRDVLVLGMSFFLVYTSFQAIQNLQSSLNEEDNLGVVSLACGYGAVFFSSFLTPAFVHHMGVKATIITAWAGHCLWVLVNMAPHWTTLVPGSILVGALSCPLWTSMEMYITSLAWQEVSSLQQVSEKEGEVAAIFHASFSRLNGAFFSVFMGSQVSGNLISSAVLFQSSSKLWHGRTDEVTQQCGVHFCSSADHEKQRLATPDPGVVRALLSIFLMLALWGAAVTIFYLPDLERPVGHRRRGRRDAWRKVVAHWQHLAQPRTWLLVPFLVSRMMNLAVQVGTFTQAYISCALGVHMVGYIMSCWGLATMLSAAILGWLASYTGRRLLCVSALTMDAVIFLSLSLWEPREDQMWVFFGLAALMGLVEGLWVVQVNALVATLFPLTADSAFALKGMWSSFSMAMAFLMASFLCPLTRLLVAVATIAVAFVSYVVLEARYLW